MTAALLPVSPWLRPECLTQFACQMMLWAGSASFTLPCIYVQQRVSQEGQIKWTRPMETQACLWCKSPARMFIALIGEKLWLFQTTDDLGSRYSLHFCVHPNRPDIHSFISCCNHSLALSFTGVCFFSPPSPAVRMDTRVSFPSRRLLVLLCTAAALLGTRSPLAAAGRSCSDTRQVYLEKGYSTSTAPLTQISGKTVPIPQSGNKLKHTVLGTHIGQSVMIWYKKKCYIYIYIGKV